MTSRTRRALVTGTSRGLGAACVEVLSAAGWDVISSSRTPGQAGVEGVERVVWDVTDDDVRPLHDALEDGPLDLLINNAGAGTPGGPLEDVDVATVLSVCDVNVGGVIRATRAALRNLRRSPNPLVLNISSRLGSIRDQADGRYRDFGTSYAYRISKAAQNMTTTCLANELGPEVRVWSVHPGSLATGMGRSDAGGNPVAAAAKLLELADSTETSSPRFVELGHGELPW